MSPLKTAEAVADEVVVLVDRARSGDAEAFAGIYDRYLNLVYCYLLSRVGGDRMLAEDLTSETFLRALRNIASFEWVGRDISAWLLTIARNLAYDYFKSRRGTVEVLARVPVEATEVVIDPEDEALSHLTYAELHAAIRRLTTEQREVVYWRFMQGYSIAETAAVMDKNPGAIKALQYRAVTALSALVAPRVTAVAVGA